jgi:hypothetical protein
MQQKAPTNVSALTGAVITTAEAMETRKPIIGLPAVNLKEKHSDMSQLPDRSPQVWKAPQRPTALQVPAVP